MHGRLHAHCYHIVHCRVFDVPPYPCGGYLCGGDQVPSWMCPKARIKLKKSNSLACSCETLWCIAPVNRQECVVEAKYIDVKPARLQRSRFLTLLTLLYSAPLVSLMRDTHINSRQTDDRPQAVTYRIRTDPPSARQTMNTTYINCRFSAMMFRRSSKKRRF